MNTAIEILNPIVVTEVYDKPISPGHFHSSAAYGEYIHKFYERPLSERLIARTFTVLPKFPF